VTVGFSASPQVERRAVAPSHWQTPLSGHLRTSVWQRKQPQFTNCLFCSQYQSVAELHCPIDINHKLTILPNILFSGYQKLFPQA